MSILTGLLDLTCWIWRRWLCETIDKLRPGAGHCWTVMSEPVACVWCGCSRPAIAPHRRRTGVH